MLQIKENLPNIQIFNTCTRIHSTKYEAWNAIIHAHMLGINNSR